MKNLISLIITLRFQVTTLKVYFKELTLQTRERVELIDTTEQITDFVRECKVESGVCIIDSHHSTTAIIVNEHEMGLMKDIQSKIREDFPRGGGWLHDRIDDNADAHLASVFLGHSKIFPVKMDCLTEVHGRTSSF